jgi:hypothetical protein
MEYCLGAGDGTATVWDRGPDIDLDGDGRLDAVSLDFDGDGLADDALADLDGDGIADHAPRRATSPTTDRGRGLSPLTVRCEQEPLLPSNCAGSGSTASSTPAGRWLISTPTDSPTTACSTATATGWPTT